MTLAQGFVQELFRQGQLLPGHVLALAPDASVQRDLVLGQGDLELSAVAFGSAMNQQQ